MHGKLFLHHHDNNQIWNLRFKSGSCAAINKYIQTVSDLNDKIVSGKIKTRNPICIRWDFSEGVFTSLQKLVFRSKMSPPPPELSYRVAYILESKLKMLEVQAFTDELSQRRVERAYFAKSCYDESTRWLLHEGSSVEGF